MSKDYVWLLCFPFNLNLKPVIGMMPILDRATTGFSFYYKNINIFPMETTSCTNTKCQMDV